jgi:RHS repeat-associated protein
MAVRTIVDEVDEGLQWILTDHLGSTSVVANEDGSLVSQVKYTAFGEMRAVSGDMPTDYKYTGQLEQAEIGLYYYVARWYDPYLTQMTQPDSIIPDPYNPLSWNRYSYVYNNPVRYNDPTGHKACEGTKNCNNPIKTVFTKTDYVSMLGDEFGWTMHGEDWLYREVQKIYEVANDILAYVIGNKLSIG